ncbi:MAG: hypothetical protein KGO22_14550 [Gammaproteobacteria bacterium]|nr:hypothetical protein [Gammaproteobacteria bacterium]
MHGHPEASRPRISAPRAAPSRTSLERLCAAFCTLVACGVWGSAWACGSLPQPVPPYDITVRQRILPEEEKLLVGLVRDGRRLVLDGEPVFNGSDKFLPGKIALALADYLVSLPSGDPRLPPYLDDYRRIARLTIDDTNHTWGIYYYLRALQELMNARLLQRAVDPGTLARLRVRLDWRTFVDVTTYTLIHLPNNYYVVALGAARLRHALGWEGPQPQARLYARIAEHYHEYSGVYGFADETNGDGRFDRYSVLLAGELANHFLETGDTPPPEVLVWLRKSAAVMMGRLHADGAGFEYGRSLGPYADTAIIETLTAAARLGVLSKADEALAYAYASSAALRYADFWIDPRTGSVNLWDGGRRTDDYRGKFRILGENLSLAHQFAYTDAAWNSLAYRGVAPMRDFAAALQARHNGRVTWFARGKYDRVLVTLRDGCHVIGLPLVNGGQDQHMHNPYFPIPFSRGMLAGVPDGTAPLLVPRFKLADGSVLMPLVYFRNVHIRFEDGATWVRYRQDAVDRMSLRMPVPDRRLAVVTSYVFRHGEITRTDTYTPAEPLSLTSIRLELGTFSSGGRTVGNATVFGHGDITSFAVAGLVQCSVRSLRDERRYETDTGPMPSLVTCMSGPRRITAPFTIRWSLKYH